MAIFSRSTGLLLLSMICGFCDFVIASDSQPNESTPSRHWFISFFFNLIGYSTILLPGAALVVFAKSKSCPPQIRRCYIIRLFVFGKELHEHVDVEQQQDVSDIEDDKSPPCGSLHRVANGKNAFNASRVILFAGCFVGLQVSYLLWGLLQEKIMTTNYTATDSHPDTLAAVPSHRQLSTFTPLPTHALQADPLIRTFQFHDSQFLVLVNRVLAFVVAVMAIIAKRRINEKGTSYKKLGPLGSGKRFSIAPLHEFSFCSISNILSSWCQYEALKYVNFPTQVLSKACKLLPVMIMSTIISGKKYRIREYTIVIVISCGMFLFLVGNEGNGSTGSHYMTTDASIVSVGHHPDGHAAKDTHRRFSLIDGLLILSLYLTFDSFTSNWQENLNAKYQVSPLQMMAAVNFFSILLTTTSLAQQSHLIPSLLTVLSNASLTRDCLLMSLSSATGQLMIFYTISEFGALAFTFIMTLRQVFAIVLSCLVYGHPLSDSAFAGICIVFVGLFAQIYFKSRKTWASCR